MTIKGYVNDGHFVMKRSSVNNYVNDLGYEIIYKGSYLHWQSLNPRKYPEFEYPENIIDVLKLNDHAHDWYREDLIKKIFNKQMLERKANGLEVMTFEQWKKQNKEFGRLVKND